MDQLAVAVDAGHVGEEVDPLRADAERERGRGLVGVDVQRAARERRDDGDETGVERLEHRRRGGRQRAADEPELGHEHRLEPDLVTRERHRLRPDRRTDRGVHALEALADDLEPLRRRYTPTGDELHVEAAPLHLLGDLGAGAVDDAHPVSRGAQLRDRLGHAAGGRAADLQHDDAHVRYSALILT